MGIGHQRRLPCSALHEHQVNAYKSVTPNENDGIN